MVKMSFNADINFPPKDGPVNSEVTSYFLSPEEHAKYLSPEILAIREARKLVQENIFLTPHEIVEMTGAPFKKVQNMVYNERHKRTEEQKRKRPSF